MEKEICKIGFPINALGKYKELIKKNIHTLYIILIEKKINQK